jgi:hypothetical protein
MSINNEQQKDEELCFVISPIGPGASNIRARSDFVLEEIIEPAAKDNGLKIMRSDADQRPGLITSQIIRHLLNAKMVVADLTDQNANVFYELALRHAFRRPVVQMILKGQAIPFDTHGLRTIEYALPDDASTPEKLREAFQIIEKARNDVSQQISAALSPNYEVESTVTLAARLEELTRSKTPESQTTQIMETILEQISSLNKSFQNMKSLVFRSEDVRDAVPALIQNQIESLFQAYSDEIGLTKLVRQAGLKGIFKRRAVALQMFASALDEEVESIMIIGSSLKGLLQRPEYKVYAEKLKFKNQYVQIRFLLTHPIIADLRAKQEGRAPGEIGRDIIRTLKVLDSWGVDPSNVRLYLGTPTCFGIKTSRYMLLNPYPFMSIGFDSPCFVFEHFAGGGPEYAGYFYDEFSSRHFGAWETELSVPITNFDHAISSIQQNIDDYSNDLNNLVTLGMTFEDRER